MAVLAGGGHVPGDSLVEGLRLAFEGWKIPTPLDERTFPEAHAPGPTPGWSGSASRGGSRRRTCASWGTAFSAKKGRPGRGCS
ncbi:MAG: hypothetical protein MZV64_13235 [Ignavibacteriales bacterium]|nr:hypothetical protein [Ignavibacteriales bacterium]